MRSVSKSFVGLLAGIAIGEGAINPCAPVLDYFPSSPICAIRSATPSTSSIS